MNPSLSFPLILLIVAIFCANTVSSNEHDEEMKIYCKGKDKSIDALINAEFACQIAASVSYPPI